MGVMLEILKSSNKSIEKTTHKLEALKLLLSIDSDLLALSNGNVEIQNKIEVSTVFQTKDMTVTLATWKEADLPYPVHCHNDSIEYLIITNGRFLLQLGDAIRVMYKGECASIPRGMEHSTTSLTDDAQLIAICVPPEAAYMVEEDKCQR